MICKCSLKNLVERALGEQLDILTSMTVNRDAMKKVTLHNPKINLDYRVTSACGLGYVDVNFVSFRGYTETELSQHNPFREQMGHPVEMPRDAVQNDKSLMAICLLAIGLMAKNAGMFFCLCQSSLPQSYVLKCVEDIKKSPTCALNSVRHLHSLCKVA